MDNKRELEIHLYLTREGEVMIPGVIVTGASISKRKSQSSGGRTNPIYQEIERTYNYPRSTSLNI